MKTNPSDKEEPKDLPKVPSWLTPAVLQQVEQIVMERGLKKSQAEDQKEALFEEARQRAARLEADATLMASAIRENNQGISEVQALAQGTEAAREMRRMEAER